MVQIDLKRHGELLQRSNSTLLVSRLNSRNHWARYLGCLRQVFLCEPAILTPDFYRAFPGKAALGDFERYQFVLAALHARLRRVIGSYVGKHLRIVHELLQLIHGHYGELSAITCDSFDAHQYIPPLGPTSKTSITRRSSC